MEKYRCRDVVASLSVIGTSEKEEMRMEKEKERKGNKEIDREREREREREKGIPIARYRMKEMNALIGPISGKLLRLRHVKK